MSHFNYNITQEDATEQIKKRIALAEVHLELLDKVLPVIKTFEGKQITKRIETAIKKVLPEYITHFSKSYSWWEIVIWSSKWEHPLNYQERMSIMLQYYSDYDLLKMEKVMEHNQRYLLDKERLPKYREALPKVQEWIEMRNEIEAKEKALYQAMEKHDLQYILG